MCATAMPMEIAKSNDECECLNVVVVVVDLPLVLVSYQHLCMRFVGSSKCKEKTIHKGKEALLATPFNHIE